MPTANALAGWPRGERYDATIVILYLALPHHAPILRRRIPLDGLNPAVYAAWRRGSVSTRGRPTLRRGRPNSHFGCREHDDDDEPAVRRSLAHCCAPRRFPAVRRADVAAAECRRPGQGQRQSGAAAAA